MEEKVLDIFEAEEVLEVVEVSEAETFSHVNQCSKVEA